MTIGSDPEIGVVFTTWGKMSPESQQKWFDTLKKRVESGNLLAGYAEIVYPTRKQVQK